MFRSVFPLAFGPLFLLSSVASAQTLELPLEYKKHPDQRRQGEEFSPYGFAASQVEAKCPAGDYTLPEFTGEHPLFCTIKLGDSSFLTVLDLQKKGDRFPNRTFFDSNCNRDLTDDPVLDGHLIFYNDDEYCMVSFETSPDVTFQRDGAVLPYSLQFSINGHNLKDFDLSKLGSEPYRYMSFQVSTYCSYATSFELDGKTYRVVLGDRNCDGDFAQTAFIDKRYLSADRRQFYASGDSLYLTSADKITYEDEATLANRLLLGDHLFDVEIDTLARKLTLTPITEGRLALKLSYPPERLLLHDQDFKQSVMMYRPGAVARIPAGEYRILNYQVFKRGQDGELWLLGADGTNDSPFVTLDDANEATLPFGEPFVHYATVPSYSAKTFRQNPERGVRIQFEIEGSGKELVNNLSLVSGKPGSIEMSRENKDLPLEPKYTIVKATGEKVNAGSFEYG